jgi:hypothetical protein
MPNRQCDERHTFCHGRHAKYLWRPSCTCNERNALQTRWTLRSRWRRTLHPFNFLPSPFIHIYPHSFTFQPPPFQLPNSFPINTHQTFLHSPQTILSYQIHFFSFQITPFKIHSSQWREIRILEISSSDPKMKIIKGSNSSVSNSEASFPPGTPI